MISQHLSRSALLRQKLHFFFTIFSLQVQDEIIIKSSKLISLSVKDIATFPTHSLSKRYHIDLLSSSSSLNSLSQNLISMHSNPFTFKLKDQSLHLRTNAFISSLKKE